MRIPRIILNVCRFILLLLLWYPFSGETQVITTVAGTGVEGFEGDGGPATLAKLHTVSDVWAGANNCLYIADINNGRIRKIDLATGMITTVAGSRSLFTGLSGVGGDALQATFYPNAVCTDRFNNIYITDEPNATVLKIDAVTNMLKRHAGSGIVSGSVAPGNLAINTTLYDPYYSCVDDSGHVYITDISYRRIRKVDAITGILTNVAGTGGAISSGDGGPATLASFNRAEAICLDPEGNLYIAELQGRRIRKVDKKTGIISTIAGNGGVGPSGEGGTAVQAAIGSPSAIASDGAGNIYFATFSAIYKVDKNTNILTRIAGTGNLVFTGDVADGTPALTAELRDIRGITISSSGDLYFANGSLNKVRKINAVVPVTCTPSVVIAASAMSICDGSRVTFTTAVANEGTSPVFEWYRNGHIVGSGNTYATTELNFNDVVTCKLTSNAACATQASVVSNRITVDVIPILEPSIEIFANSRTICAGSSVRFELNARHPHNASFHWKVNQVTVHTTPNTIFSTTDLKNGDVVTCEMVTKHNCATTNNAMSSAVTITVIPLVSPSVVITSSAITACGGTPIDFTAAAVNAGTSPQYTWNVNGTAVPNSNTASFSGNGFKDGDIVTCTVTSNATCVANASGVSNPLITSILPSPKITIQSSALSVCGETGIDFVATTSNSGNAPRYQWQVNGVNDGSGSGRYSTSKLKNGDKVKCILTANTVCNTPVSSNEINITVNELPSVQMDSVRIILQGQSVQFSPVVSSNVVAYQWTPSTGLSRNNIADPVAAPLATLMYKLTVFTSAGCEASAYTKLTVLTPVNAPNVFSPNGDGINDAWQIPGLSSYPGCTVDVYNRGGQLIFHSAGYDRPWDGSFNGKMVPEGTYYYIINPKNGFGLLSGSVTVIK
jgi:gliding motility-associated-like protein